MAWQKLVRTLMKVVIAVIGISVALTSVIGILSVFQTMTQSDAVNIDTANSKLNCGSLGNNITMSLSLNNRGLIEFQNFSGSLKVTFQNKSSGNNFTVLNKMVFNQNLPPNQISNISLNAGNTDFDMTTLLPDNNGRYDDPVVVNYVNTNKAGNFSGTENLQMPYLLTKYDVIIEVILSSNYNLGLIYFAITIPSIYPYASLGVAPYPTLRMNQIGV